MPEYDQHRSVGRQRGNLLPHPVAQEVNSECKRYFIDPEKYKVEGSVDPISEIETYKAPEVTLEAIKEIPCENPDVARTRRENFLSKPKKDMPAKEDLIADMKKMTNTAIAKKYKVSISLVINWLKYYGIQRKKGAMITVNDIEITSTPEIILEPSPEQIEQFYTDVPQEDPKHEELTVEEKEKLVELGYTEFAPKREYEEIWSDVQADITTLRDMYIDKAVHEFGERFSEMIKGVYGSDIA